MVNLQDKPIVVGSPIEIEFACNELRKQIASLGWMSHPYFIAQRFRSEDSVTKREYIFPETYAPNVNSLEDNKKLPYHKLTPDNDYSGMCFFMVGDGRNDYNNGEHNFLTYPVSIIFSVNLQLINEAKLLEGLFTQDLIRDVRRLLTNSAYAHEFQYKILRETRDLESVYREFRLRELEQYNRAPLQCFRFDLEVTIEEFCDGFEPQGITGNGQPVSDINTLTQRVTDLEEQTDGLISGTTILTFYELAKA